ncbi:phosphate ABC transporter permease subunit PstC [Garciella nitratireducens]|nr:phosphate ABC transporter permease subunit PstC [Garciella nitratireducens]
MTLKKIRHDWRKKKKIGENLIEKLFFICAFIAVLSIILITMFIFYRGLPAIAEIGFKDFILKKEWRPSAKQYGIFSMIIGSIYSTIGAIIVGVPIGVLTAIFLSEMVPKPIVKILKPCVELLAGIPSVVYGFFGLTVFVPLIHEYLGGSGNSLLATSLILGIMILPTIINISMSSINAVPKEYKEGSLALGVTHIQTIFRVILPAARSGILAAVVLGIGRAIGETMAVVLVSGNSPIVPGALIDKLRTMTGHIALEMKYAMGLQEDALFATGVVLFIFIMIINLILNILTHKAGDMDE